MMNACADDMSMDSLKGTVTKDDVDSPAIRIESLVPCRDNPWMRGMRQVQPNSMCMY